jgi:hypothetical protein
MKKRLGLDALIQTRDMPPAPFAGAKRRSIRSRMQPGLRLVLCLAACASGAAFACDANKIAETPGDPSAPVSADRLQPDEALPEAEIAFGLAMPRGMRVTRYFDDSAYFTGPLDKATVLEQIKSQLLARDVELSDQRAVFPLAYIKGDAARRHFRIEVTGNRQGSQVYVKNITPVPAPRGLSQAEIWRRAGRKPDGSLLDPNRVY